MKVLDSIKNSKPGDTIWDREEAASVHGLHLRHLETKKMFYLRYRSREGVQRRPKIGELGQITLAQARSIAKDLMLRVSKGEDPQGDWSAARAEMTVAELFERAWKTHWNKPRYQKSGWAKEVQGYWTRNIEPTFGRARLSTVKVADVRAWHESYRETPYAGNRALEVLTRMFSVAEADELIPRNTTPCWKIKGFTEKKRRRYASPAELAKILTILEREKDNNRVAVTFLYCLIFTGSRPEVLEVVRPEDLKPSDYEGTRVGILSFSGKGSEDSGEEESVVVPADLMAMIERLPRQKDGTIFGRKIPYRFWYKVRKEAGCPDLWARDLRRTFATVGMSGGVTEGVIGKLLNHASVQTTGIYAKLDQSARIAASATIADRITQIGKVVPIR